MKIIVFLILSVLSSIAGCVIGFYMQLYDLTIILFPYGIVCSYILAYKILKKGTEWMDDSNGFNPLLD